MPPHDHHPHPPHHHPAHITLRGLPLPAKLVLSVFLCAVGLGYFSALVQLHMKHSMKVGEPLPNGGDLVEVFSGLKPFDPNAPKACSRVDTVLSGDRKAEDVTKANMAPAFFAKSKGWGAAGRARANNVAELEAEHTGELEAFLAWIRSDGSAKKEAYEKDHFPLPAELKGKPITKEFAGNGGVKVKSLVQARCMNCHDTQDPPLGTYAQLEPLITAPSQDVINGKWVKSSRQLTYEKLTQSTHAHLLTFSVLFGMTGLVFAFTTYWKFLRCVLGPIVLLAQVADIACWWLARLPETGPMFALAIMGTGAVVGLGLDLQIILSLLNMYGRNGKAIMVILLMTGVVGVGFVGMKVIQPALEIEKKEADKAKEPKPEPVAKKPDAVAKISHLEQLVMGPREATDEIPFKGVGTMGPAFFNADSEFKELVKDHKGDAKFLDALIADREGERLALQAWMKLKDAERKKAYDADKFALPKELAGKPVTKEWIDKGSLKVKKLIEMRCTGCHGKDGEAEEYSLETYEQLSKYFAPKK